MRFVFFCLIYFVLVLPGHAQERVRNVRIRVLDSARLEIRYDLLTTQPGDSVYLQMRSRLRGSLRILPEFVRGDVGIDVSAGSDRQIVWDALANGYSLNEEVQAIVLVKTVAPKLTESVVITQPKPAQPTTPAATTPTPQNRPKRNQPTKPSVFAVDSAATPTTPEPKTAPPVVAVTPTQPPTSTAVPPPVQVPPAVPQSVTTTIDSVSTVPASKVRRRYAGPAWALLSALAPGVGNIFVQMPKPKMGLRPLVTVLCYGAVAYGITERQKANDTYAIYVQQKNMTDGEPYYQTANDHYHRYFLATRGAALVAAADIVLTFIKGLRNSQLQKEARRIQGVTIRPGWQAGQPTAVLQYSF